MNFFTTFAAIFVLLLVAFLLFGEALFSLAAGWGLILSCTALLAFLITGCITTLVRLEQLEQRLKALEEKDTE